MSPVTITYLEMTERPAYPRPHLPPGPPAMLLRAERPPAWWFLTLYRTVGAPYRWTDWLEVPQADVAEFVQNPDVALYTLMRGGWPAGFFVLDYRTRARCTLAYLGLVPQAVGRGLGRYLLREAVHLAWDGDGVEVVAVETCTLDHPRALGLYQSAGFSPVSQATRPHPDDPAQQD